MSCLRILLLVPLFLSSGMSGCLASSSSAASGCSCGDSTAHDFSSFTSDSAAELVLLKDAGISNGVLHLTADSSRNRNRSGAALMPGPVTLWCQDPDDDAEAKQDASFEASFTMGIVSNPSPDEEGAVQRKGDAGGGGGGLALVMVASLNSPALGILGLSNNPSDQVSSSSASSGFVTFTFNTVKLKQSNGDPDDSNGTVINLDVVVSVSGAVFARSPPLTITTATATNNQVAMKNCTVWIDYNNGRVSIYVDVQGRPKPDKAAIDGVALNLSDHLPQRAFVGLLASTDTSTELHSVLSWNLQVSLPGDGPSMDWKVILPAVLGGITFTGIMNLLVAVFYFNSKYNKLKMELVLSETLRRLPGMPREFKHATMRKATDNFHEARRLGKGGFGAVYRGTLRSAGKNDGVTTCVEVAVKKFTRDENRCYDDFLAEVDIINRLRHRNIVPLVGWCYEKGELLLIYEYMPNGSLDHHLFPNKEHQGRILGWTTRYGIIADVAAGLHYVHHEHEHMVLHRDIKASNIMLDSTFHGRLGDFGLARIVGFDKNSYTDLGVAGTWGFIAPEYSVSRKSTRKTDIYAFGVLTLEMVTGRRALSTFQDTFQVLTDWVWRLHREGRLLEAVDRNAISTQEYDADGAARLLLLGLACTNPNPLDRPSMAEVVQVVSKSVPAPDVPPEKPTFVWPPDERVPRSSFDDITEMMSDLHESHRWEETSSSDALAASAIIRRKAWAESVELYCL